MSHSESQPVTAQATPPSAPARENSFYVLSPGELKAFLKRKDYVQVAANELEAHAPSRYNKLGPENS